ncbi:hypothetical protein ACI3L3_16065 [Desulfobaculum sp. SPO524]|uniref:hypothetical protein n=1 Tax=Desulfobaculum sp. SPO524 TaxID=3378071 RepID=UPI003852F896
MVERVENAGRILAILVRAGHSVDGIEFFTPGDFSQQLASMRRPSGHVIPPHAHNPVQREVLLTQEVLFVVSGRLRVDFYDDECAYLSSRILTAGDVILLASGGHGFEMLEDTQLIEVKQGPYAGDHDKTRFCGVDRDQTFIPETDETD